MAAACRMMVLTSSPRSFSSNVAMKRCDTAACAGCRRWRRPAACAHRSIPAMTLCIDLQPGTGDQRGSDTLLEMLDEVQDCTASSKGWGHSATTSPYWNSPARYVWVSEGVEALQRPRRCTVPATSGSGSLLGHAQTLSECRPRVRDRVQCSSCPVPSPLVVFDKAARGFDH